MKPGISEDQFISIPDEITLEACYKLCENNFETPISGEYLQSFSGYRHSLLEWYSFEKDATFLEIGANKGALTEIFLKQGRKVVCYEKDPGKRRILKRRYGNRENFCLLGNDLENALREVKEMDYIIIHELFGELKKHWKSNAYKEFLLELKRIVSQKGKILICTYNRLGLRYLEGESEELSGQKYTGIHRFNGYNYIKTFSKTELKRMCQNLGFADIKFFYPYYSMQFPTEVYTDEIFEYFYYGNEQSFIDRKRCFHTKQVDFFDIIQEKNEAGFFANGFVVELSNTSVTNKTLYYKNYCNSDLDNPRGKLFIVARDKDWCMKYISKAGGRPGIFISSQQVSEIEMSEIVLTKQKRVYDTLLELMRKISDEMYERSEILKQIYGIFYQLRKSLMKKSSDILNRRGYFFSLDTIFVDDHNEMTIILLADDSAEEELGYYLWKMLRNWYEEHCLHSKAYQDMLDFEKIILIFELDRNTINRYDRRHQQIYEEKGYGCIQDVYTGHRNEKKIIEDLLQTIR